MYFRLFHVKKNSLFWGFLMICFAANAQVFLSEHAKISLLTTTPTDNEVYTLYGHTSIRVRDSVAANQKIDYIFNYGMFDSSAPFFIYRFAIGKTDYFLDGYDFKYFLADHQLRNSNVYEQEINLTHQEMQDLWMALINNVQPENREYRYNFFFDNCATRPAQLIEQTVNGRIIYQENEVNRTFRDIINHCTRDHPWLTFGCDLALGSPTDRVVTLQESFFIPEYVRKAFSTAQIVHPDGTSRPLVSAEYLLVDHINDEDSRISLQNEVFTPFVCSLMLFAVVLWITLIEWRRKIYVRWVDCILFFVAGMAGCILFFLCFLSEHPSIWPNISVLWLHPFHLAAVVLFSLKKLNRVAYFYHFANFVALLLMLFGWIFVTQQLNIAFIPLIATLLLRSGYCLIRNRLVRIR